jgi:hypothetical protein
MIHILILSNPSASLVPTSPHDDLVSESDIYRQTQPSPKEREPNPAMSRLAFPSDEGKYPERGLVLISVFILIRLRH